MKKTKTSNLRDETGRRPAPPKALWTQGIAPGRIAVSAAPKSGGVAPLPRKVKP